MDFHDKLNRILTDDQRTMLKSIQQKIKPLQRKLKRVEERLKELKDEADTVRGFEAGSNSQIFFGLCKKNCNRAAHANGYCKICDGSRKLWNWKRKKLSPAKAKGATR